MRSTAQGRACLPTKARLVIKFLKSLTKCMYYYFVDSFIIWIFPLYFRGLFYNFHQDLWSPFFFLSHRVNEHRVPITKDNKTPNWRHCQCLKAVSFNKSVCWLNFKFGTSGSVRLPYKLNDKKIEFVYQHMLCQNIAVTMFFS